MSDSAQGMFDDEKKHSNDYLVIDDEICHLAKTTYGEYKDWKKNKIPYCTDEDIGETDEINSYPEMDMKEKITYNRNYNNPSSFENIKMESDMQKDMVVGNIMFGPNEQSTKRILEENMNKKFDIINKPKHYNSHPSGIECIDIVKHHDFCTGNAIKYLWRQGLKDGESSVKDLKKAAYYIDKKIKELENDEKN